jgi:outer membrane beta-barrel protein
MHTVKPNPPRGKHVKQVGLLLLPLVCASTAMAAAPAYEQDPFGDEDWKDAPMILDVAHPTLGRGELGLMFSSSVIDKYNSHVGSVVDLTYSFTDTMGVDLAFGFLHGTLTPIVTDQEGIIGNRIENHCIKNSVANCDINPAVPDFDQITGLFTASFLWSPLYGKINVVSELDVNLELYALAGLGVNGTRRVQVTLVNGNQFETTGGGVGEGGLFGSPKPHLSLGGGVKVFVADWLNFRAEFRDIIFNDSFDFGKDGTEDSYRSHHYLAQLGLGFVLF